MKLSTNTIGLLIFAALATAAFAWMTMRPMAERSAVIFGMPVKGENTVVSESETKEENKQEAVNEETTVETNTESAATSSESTTPESTTPEPTKEGAETKEESVTTDTETTTN